MKRLMLAAAAFGMVACTAAAADTLKDGTVSVKSGLYNWKQKTSIVGFGKDEENTECLIPQKATMTLSRLVDDLQKGCRVENVVQTTSGYNFRMVCTGKIPGTADASLVHTDTSMTIEAKGSATVGGFIPAGFSLRADASYVGECTQDQVTKATASYYRKHPEEKPQ